MKKRITTSLLALLLGVATNAMSDELLIMGIENEPPNSLEGVPRPKPGMTMEKVKEIFGTPTTKSDTVGNPPITRWTYEKFVVVFEKEYVINAVLRKPATEGFVTNE